MKITNIIKREGNVVDFELSKIQIAIQKAFKVNGQDDNEIITTLTKEVEVNLNDMYGGQIPTVEQVQDVVEAILIKYEYADVAKSYILYRQKRTEQRADKNIMVDVDKTINEYLDKLDWRVNANSNQGYSLGGMILNTSGKVTANYWLSHIYPADIGESHRNGDLHIHDLDMFSGYCAGWSLRTLLEEGFNGVDNKTESGPPKHLSSAISQMVNFLGTLQNEWAGAQAFSSFDTYLAPFVRKFRNKIINEIDYYNLNFESEAKKMGYIEDRVYKFTYQNIQSFVFNLNIPSRWGTQTPFTNITLDWTVPDDLKDKRLILDGKPFDKTFGELENEMDIINRAYIEVMTKGDAKGRVFTFPIPTYNITKEFDWDDPKTIPLFEMTAKYGTPYFQNFINSDLNPGDVRSMCCRLQLDLKELKKRGNGLFGSSEMTGSIGVVTINAGRLGHIYAGDEVAYFRKLDMLLELAKTSLEIKRKEIQKWIDNGLFPYTKRYLGYLKNHFSTIGINGLNESIRNFTNDQDNIISPEGKEFAIKVLQHMRKKMSEFQEESGNLYNLEASPAEGATYRFAKEDKKRFRNIITAGSVDAPYYTNSSQIPVGYTDDVFEALIQQDELQTLYTGGTVLHCYIGERIPNAVQCRDLVKKILTKFKLPYITITPTFSICPDHGYLTGEWDYCPKCDEILGFDKLVRFDSNQREKYLSINSSR